MAVLGQGEHLQVQHKDLKMVPDGEVQHHALKGGHGLPEQEEGVLLILSTQRKAFAVALSLSRFHFGTPNLTMFCIPVTPVYLLLLSDES